MQVQHAVCGTVVGIAAYLQHAARPDDMDLELLSLLLPACLCCRVALERQIAEREAQLVVDDTDMSPRERQLNAPLLRKAAQAAPQQRG